MKFLLTHMKNNLRMEFAVSLMLMILLILILNPLHFWMPDQAHMMMIIALAVLFMIFASFIVGEKTKDERDMVHRSIASRFAYLMGTGMLVCGIITQLLYKSVDIWLILVLAVMIGAKICGLLYAQSHY